MFQMYNDKEIKINLKNILTFNKERMFLNGIKKQIQIM